MNMQITDIQSDIKRLANDFEKTFENGNISEITNFYTDDAILLPAGTDFVHGKNDISLYWQETKSLGVKSIKLDMVEVEQHGDTAIEMSKYTLHGEDDQVIDAGKGMVIWKFQQGSWKLHRDIWNSSLA